MHTSVIHRLESIKRKTTLLITWEDSDFDISTRENSKQYENYTMHYIIQY